MPRSGGRRARPEHGGDSQWAPAGYESYASSAAVGQRAVGESSLFCCSAPSRARPPVQRPPIISRELHIQEEPEPTPQLDRAAVWAAQQQHHHEQAADGGSLAKLPPAVVSPSREPSQMAAVTTAATLEHQAKPDTWRQLLSACAIGGVAAGGSVLWRSTHGPGGGNLAVEWPDAAVSLIVAALVALLAALRTRHRTPIAPVDSTAKALLPQVESATGRRTSLADVEHEQEHVRTVTAGHAVAAEHGRANGNADEDEDEEESLLVASLSPSNLQALDDLCQQCADVIPRQPRSQQQQQQQQRRRRPFLRRATLSRYLRARGDDVRKAKAMLEHTIGWRGDLDVWGPVSHNAEAASMAWLGAAAAAHPQPAAARFATKHWYGGIHGTDRRGAPVMYTRFGTGDPARLAALCEAVGDALDRPTGVKTDLSLMRQCVALCEAFQAISPALSSARGEHLDTFIEVIDLGADDEPGWFRRAIAASRHFAGIAKVLDSNYPERVHKVFIVRAPSVFASVWRLVSPLVDAGTQAKISIYVRAHISMIEPSRLAVVVLTRGYYR